MVWSYDPRLRQSSKARGRSWWRTLAAEWMRRRRAPHESAYLAADIARAVKAEAALVAASAVRVVDATPIEILTAEKAAGVLYRLGQRRPGELDGGHADGRRRQLAAGRRGRGRRTARAARRRPAVRDLVVRGPAGDRDGQRAGRAVCPAGADDGRCRVAAVVAGGGPPEAALGPAALRLEALLDGGAHAGEGGDGGGARGRRGEHRSEPRRRGPGRAGDRGRLVRRRGVVGGGARLGRATGAVGRGHTARLRRAGREGGARVLRAARRLVRAATGAAGLAPAAARLRVGGGGGVRGAAVRAAARGPPLRPSRQAGVDRLRDAGRHALPLRPVRGAATSATR